MDKLYFFSVQFAAAHENKLRRFLASYRYEHGYLQVLCGLTIERR